MTRNMTRNFFQLETENELPYDEYEADAWRHAAPQQSRKKETKSDGAQERSGPKSMPEEVWLIPPNVRPVDILGEKRCHLQRIEKSTNTHMVYNETEAQIEMWGSREDIDQALKQWCTLAENVLNRDLQERSKRKVKGWAKPAKALTEKQQRKMKRREAREREERDYRGFPPDKKLFNGHFVFPNSTIPISQIIGEKEEILHPVRAETKCYMWYEPAHNLIRIVGDSYDSVEDATMRVKHLYIKSAAFRSIPSVTRENVVIYKGWVFHMIEPPHKPYKVRIANPPSWFVKPHDIGDVFKLLEPVLEGDKISVVGKGGVSRELNPNSNFDAIHNIRVSNVKRIEEALLKAFGTIHLFDEEVKMRIRFGHVCLTDFPKEPLWPIDRLNDKILSDPRLQSKFATCVATDRKQLNPLFEVLSECDRQWDGSPFREFKIYAMLKPHKKPNSSGRNVESQPHQCVFDVQFKEDGKIGLWNVTTNEKNILDLNMSCLDNVYSWKLNIKTAKRLPNDKGEPQGTFVYKLRLSQHDHLVYSNTDDISVTSVCEKTKWKYWWGDYVVEVTRYKFWQPPKNMTYPSGVEVSLDKEPATITFGVSFYRKSWEDDFAFNSNLNVGETPEWHPYDIMEQTGGINVLLSEIRNFLEVLQDKLPMPEGNNNS